MAKLKNAFKHGMVKTKSYTSWASMKQRCLNLNNPSYKNYGGRGIKICKKWMDFIGFYEDMGDRPITMSLDRINNNGNYCKSNCRWATKKQQDNNRRSNKYLFLDGIKRKISEWSNLTGINISTLSMRKNVYKWNDKKCLTTKPSYNTSKLKIKMMERQESRYQ